MSKVDAQIQTSGKNYELLLDPYRKVVFGDENSLSFRPCARYSAFGEDGSGMIFSTPTVKNISPVLDKGIIGWDDPDNNMSVRFYEHSDPGRYDSKLEHEVILWSAPPSPDIPFSIELPNLNLWYQPTLKEEDNKRGFFRPAEMMGGWCAYHKVKGPLHFIPGEASIYKAGKAFDLQRPTATDAQGNVIWGLWEFDGISLMTARFDPDWLKAAAYPVTIGPTIGNTHLGSSEDATDRCCLATDVTAGSSGDANPGTAFYGGRMTSGTGSVQVCPYVGGGSNPNGKARIGTGSANITLNTTAAFQSAAITWTGIVSGTHYWLSGWSNINNVRTEYDAGGATGTFVCAPTSGATPSDPYPTTSGAFNNLVSVYVDFTASGGAAFVPLVGGPGGMAGMPLAGQGGGLAG